MFVDSCAWGVLTLTLSRSFDPFVFWGLTGKMVKKVCPCNQLCSNYLSFCSFLLPSSSFTASVFHPHPSSPSSDRSDPQLWDFSSAQSLLLGTEVTDLSWRHRLGHELHVSLPPSRYCWLTHLDGCYSVVLPPRSSPHSSLLLHFIWHDVARCVVSQRLTLGHHASAQRTLDFKSLCKLGRKRCTLSPS